MSTPYTPAYFIAKFEAIPDELWCVNHYAGPGGSHCAIGHCEGIHSAEADALRGLLPTPAAGINDGNSSKYQQPTPKARILAALRDLPQT